MSSAQKPQVSRKTERGKTVLAMQTFLWNVRHKFISIVSSAQKPQVSRKTERGKTVLAMQTFQWNVRHHLHPLGIFIFSPPKEIF